MMKYAFSENHFTSVKNENDVITCLIEELHNFLNYTRKDFMHFLRIILLPSKSGDSTTGLFASNEVQISAGSENRAHSLKDI